MPEPPCFDDDVEDLTPFLPRQSEVLAKPVNPEEQLKALQRGFPAVPRDALMWFISNASQVHIEAALRDHKKRPRHTLGILLRGKGVASSNDFVWEDGKRMGGNFVFLKELRDEGFIIDSRPIPNGTLFTLSTKDFNDRASRRDTLGDTRRRIVLEYYGKCQRCESTKDLEVDHRVAVLIGDAPQEGPFLVTDWQALCRSCNSLKSQACEQCPLQDRVRCVDCFWANPKDHTHRAGEPGFWYGPKLPDALVLAARKAGKAPHVLIERLLQSAAQQLKG